MHSSPPTLIQLFTGIAGNSSTTIWYTVNPVDSITILITFQHLRTTHQACEPLLPTAAPPSLVWPWQCTSQRRGREEDSSPAYFLHHKYIYFCRSGLGALITPLTRTTAGRTLGTLFMQLHTRRSFSFSKWEFIALVACSAQERDLEEELQQSRFTWPPEFMGQFKRDRDLCPPGLPVALVA